MEGHMAWLNGAVIASIDMRAMAICGLVTAMVVTSLILVCSTVLFFFYIFATARTILRRKQ
jgi:hypothetical protein